MSRLDTAKQHSIRRRSACAGEQSPHPHLRIRGRCARGTTERIVYERPFALFEHFVFVRFASDGCAPLPSLLSYTRGIEAHGAVG